MALTVLIVDDDDGFRGVVEKFLDGEPGLKVLGEARDGAEAVELARSLRPDVILMDIAMPRLDGLGATRRLKAELPRTMVILLTVHDEEAYRRAASGCGADGFILKKNLPALLVPMLKKVRQ